MKPLILAVALSLSACTQEHVSAVVDAGKLTCEAIVLAKPESAVAEKCRLGLIVGGIVRGVVE